MRRYGRRRKVYLEYNIMSVITQKSFEAKWPKWMADPDVDESVKRGASFTDADAMVLADTCLMCGEKLLLPYIYWNGCGDDGNAIGISLHEKCARRLAKAITRDADEISAL